MLFLINNFCCFVAAAAAKRHLDRVFTPRPVPVGNNNSNKAAVGSFPEQGTPKVGLGGSKGSCASSALVLDTALVYHSKEGSSALPLPPFFFRVGGSASPVSGATKRDRACLTGDYCDPMCKEQMLRGRRYSVRPWVIIASASARTAKLVQVCRTIFAGLELLPAMLGQIPSCLCRISSAGRS